MADDQPTGPDETIEPRRCRGRPTPAPRHRTWSTQPNLAAWSRRLRVAAVVAIFVAAVAVRACSGGSCGGEQVTRLSRPASGRHLRAGVTSIDSNKVDESFDQVLAGATGN